MSEAAWEAAAEARREATRKVAQPPRAHVTSPPDAKRYLRKRDAGQDAMTSPMEAASAAEVVSQTRQAEVAAESEAPPDGEVDGEVDAGVRTNDGAAEGGGAGGDGGEDNAEAGADASDGAGGEADCPTKAQALNAALQSMLGTDGEGEGPGSALPPSAEDHVVAAFAARDLDGSGSIEISEMHEIFADVDGELGMMSSVQYKEYVGAYFSRLDTDRSGALDLNEFRSFYKRCLSSERARRALADKTLRSLRAKEALAAKAREIFHEADKDGSGRLSAEELGALLQITLGEVYTTLKLEGKWEAYVADTLRRGDKDGDAAWDVEEFTRFHSLCLASKEVSTRYEAKVLLRYDESSQVMVIDTEALAGGLIDEIFTSVMASYSASL